MKCDCCGAEILCVITGVFNHEWDCPHNNYYWDQDEQQWMPCEQEENLDDDGDTWDAEMNEYRELDDNHFWENDYCSLTEE